MIRPLVASLSVLGLVACMAASTPPAAAEQPSEYTLTVTAPAPLKVAEKGSFLIAVDVKPGYHWNDEYPATFTVNGAPAELGLTKALLAQLSGDFKSQSPTTVRVPVEAKPTAATDAKLTVDAHFSVCNERVCLLKNATATVQVVAR
ncbi:MAG: hypothetical protein U1F43_23490 [Myxococcota bacterium]